MALSVAAGAWLTTFNWPFSGHKALAVVLFVAGYASCCGRPCSSAYNTSRWTRATPPSPHVVTHGVHRFTRKTMYLGMALMLVGVAARTARLLGMRIIMFGPRHT